MRLMDYDIRGLYVKDGCIAGGIGNFVGCLLALAVVFLLFPSEAQTMGDSIFNSAILGVCIGFCTGIAIALSFSLEDEIFCGIVCGAGYACGSIIMLLGFTRPMSTDDMLCMCGAWGALSGLFGGGALALVLGEDFEDVVIIAIAGLFGGVIPILGWLALSGIAIGGAVGYVKAAVSLNSNRC